MKITFLLEYQKKDGDRYTLSGDFATLNEARIFYRYTNQPPLKDNEELPTGLKIVGIKPGLRLYEDSYYKLDIGRAQIQRTGNTSFESYIIDFSNVRFEQGETIIENNNDILSSLDKAQTSMLEGKLATLLDSIPDSIEGESEFVRVNNVGQGNWNEYHIGNRIPLVYDLGTNMNASNADIRALIDKIFPNYKASPKKPLLVISHWDLDHYKCLLELQMTELILFECFVVKEILPTATAKKAYDRIKSIPRVKILAISSPTSHTSSEIVQLIEKENKVSLYHGIGNNRNTTGIIVNVSNKNALTILSGDCAWYQINHLLREEAITKKKRCCNIVVPHHGSGKDISFKGFVVPYTWTYSSAAISVGKKNIYKHPYSSVVNYIKGLFDRNVYRTDDKNGPIDLKM